MKKAPEQVVGYVRVSTEDQAEHRTSIDSQIEMIRADAEAKGQDLVAVFSEPGVSGREEARPEFNRMLAYVEDPVNRIAEIKIVSLSRLARNLELQVRTFARLKRARVRLVSLTQSFSDDPSGNLMRNMLAMFDEHFALEAAKHTKRTMRANAMEGFFNGGPVPFGYESRTVERRGNKEKKKLFVREDEAEVVRTMFRLATVGDSNGPLGARGIAQWLQQRGFTLRGSPFNNSNVSGILGREHYTGHYIDRRLGDDGKPEPEEAWVEVVCPAIIDRAQFEAAAAFRATRAPKVTAPRITTSPILLTSVARCGLCGEGLTIRTGKSGRYSYYACGAKVNGAAERCACKAIRQEALDGIVLTALEERLFQPDRLRDLLQHMLDASSEAEERRSRELTQARSARTQAETRLRNLYDLAADGHASLKDRTFANMLADTRSRIASLTATIDILEAQLRSGHRKITPEVVDRFGALVREKLRGNEPALRRGYVRLFVSQVVLAPQEIRITGPKQALARAVSRISADGQLVPSFDREWCGREDSNFHGLSPTTTSTLRVYQFRHGRT